MKLNGIECGGYRLPTKDCVEFSLAEGTTLAQAAALDGQTLTLTEDDGETPVAVFSGYAVTAAYVSEGAVRVRAARALTSADKEAIEAAEENIGIVDGKADAAKDAAEAARVAAEAVASDIEAYMDALLGTDEGEE